MSSDETPQTPSPRERRDAVREKAQQVQVRQARASLARRLSIGTGIVAVVAVVAVAVTLVVTSAISKPNLKPANVDDDGFAITTVEGVVTNGAIAEPTPSETPTPAAESASPAATESPVVDIRVYVDYLSTGSREFQAANLQQLTQWVDQGSVSLTYYPVAMLTAKSNGTKYSMRAASAAACVATYEPETFYAFNNDLLSQQPDVETDGYTDSELAAMAIASGAKAPKLVRGCIEDEKYMTWAKDATDRALESLPDTDGLALTATPTVLVNGVQYIGELSDPKEFAQFVLTSASDAYYEEPTPSPTPTESVAETKTPSPAATK